MDVREQPARSLPPVHEAWLPREHSLHRPRHGQRQTTALVSAGVFFCIPLLLFIFGVRPEAIENRKPAEFPSAGDGWGFFTGLNPWATDNLPLRDVAIHAHGDISEGLFGEVPNFDGPQQPAAGPVAPPPPTLELPSDAGTPNSSDLGTDGFPTVIQGRDNWMYFGFDTKGKCQAAQTLNDIMANVTRLKAAVEASGRTFVLAVAPDKTTMVPEHLPSSYAGKACSAAPRTTFWRRAITELNIVDLRVPLNQQADRIREPVYFPQDSHWTFAGGLTMTKEVAERIQPGVSLPWRTKKGVEWNSQADLPRLIGRTAASKTNRFELAPDGGSDRSDYVASDFQTPLVFRTNSGMGKIGTKAAMVADSFSQFASPFIGAVFSDISITHVGQFAKDAKPVADRLADAKVVIFEIVERNLSAGTSPISDPEIVDLIANTMAARPMR
jgi:alginate O-acetyltransferase complex protein AlgJ